MEVAEGADAAGAGRVEGVEVAGGMKRRDISTLIIQETRVWLGWFMGRLSMADGGCSID